MFETPYSHDQVYLCYTEDNITMAKSLLNDLAVFGISPKTEMISGHKQITMSNKTNTMLQSCRIYLFIISNSIKRNLITQDAVCKRISNIQTNNTMILPLICDDDNYYDILGDNLFSGIRFLHYLTGLSELLSALGIKYSLRRLFFYLFDEDIIRNLNYYARTHEQDHIRLACAHTLWSLRPEYAKATLHMALDDQDPRKNVQTHALGLLKRYSSINETPKIFFSYSHEDKK